MKGIPVCYTRFDESGKVVYQNNDAQHKQAIKEEKHVSPAKSIAEAKDFVFFTRCCGEKIYLTLEQALEFKDNCVIEKETK